jgi:hypothetical protein
LFRDLFFRGFYTIPLFISQSWIHRFPIEQKIFDEIKIKYQ